MSADWERRRRNLRILIAAAGTNATRLCEEVHLSPNTLTKFLSGNTARMSERSLDKLLPALGLSYVSELDTDNVLFEPRNRLRKLLDRVPDGSVESLLNELEGRFPRVLKEGSSE